MFVKRAVKKFLGKDYRLDLSARFAEYSEVLELKTPLALFYLPFESFLTGVHGSTTPSPLLLPPPSPLRCSTMASLPKQIFYRRALGDDSSKNLKETRCCRNRCKKRRRIKREFLFPVFQSLSSTDPLTSSLPPPPTLLLRLRLAVGKRETTGGGKMKKKRKKKKRRRKERNLSFHRLSPIYFSQLACFISTVPSPSLLVLSSRRYSEVKRSALKIR